jgi:uncharacterized protein (DUF2062 family)
MTYFRDKFRAIFKIKDTPHRIALAFALGVFMGISPLLGVSVNNPWTIVPISTFCVWLGAKLIGIKQVLPEVDWKNITLTSILGKMSDLDGFIYLIKKMLPIISAFFAGSFIVCTISAIAGYFIILALVTRYKKIRNA